MKKIISIVLCLVMILSVFVVVPISVGAKNVDVRNTGGWGLSNLMATFPQGAYWNHPLGTSQPYNPNSVTYTPCPGNHDDVDTCNWSGGQIWNGGSQCDGFTRIIAKDVYGSCPQENGWATTSIYNVKPGDIIHYASVTSYGHWVMVIARSGDTLTFGECNYDFHCGISWNRQDTIGHIASLNPTVYSAPYELPGGSSNRLPEGYLDSVVGGLGTITVTGWAYDPDCPDLFIGVHFYIGNVCIGTTTANLYREDLIPVLGFPHHGFSATFNVSQYGNVVVDAYGINIDENGYEIGTGNNLLKQSGQTVTVTSEANPPEISNVTISQVTSKGYRVSCKVSDDTRIGGVQFPAWKNSDQSDIVWYQGSVKDNIATAYIPSSDHGNSTGPYITHIYASDIFGNTKSVAADWVTLSDEPIEIDSVIVGDKKLILYNSGKTWTEAEQWCVEHGGHLAEASFWTEIVEMLDKNNAVPCWFGGTNTSGKWKWTSNYFNFNLYDYNSSFFYPGTGYDYCKEYPIWNKGQPDSKDEHYLGTFNGNYLGAYMFNDYSNDSSGYIGGFVYQKDREKLADAYDMVLDGSTGIWSWKGDPNADYYQINLYDEDDNSINWWNNVNETHLDTSNYMKSGTKYWIRVNSCSYDPAVMNSLFPSNWFLYQPKETHLKGDADKDDKVTISDATCIQQYLAKLIGDDKIDLEAATMAGDKLSISDATHIQQYLAKLINEL